MPALDIQEQEMPKEAEQKIYKEFEDAKEYDARPEHAI